MSGQQQQRKKRYRGYLARKLVDQHSYQDKPENVDQLLELTKIKASTIAERMKNKQIPLKFEHKDEIVSVGKVVNAAVMKDEDGSDNLVAEFEVDDTPSANIVKDCLDNFTLNGLSLTHLSESLEPLELSIVAKGARPGTIITGRPGFKEWLQSKGPDAAVSASVQQYHSEALNALVYKTLYTTDCAIRASDNSIMSSISLVRQPEGEAKHVVNMAGADDLKKIMDSVIPPNGAHPFSNPEAEAMKQSQQQKDQLIQQMQQQLQFLMLQQQQLQQKANLSLPPPPQQQSIQASSASANTAPMQIDSSSASSEVPPQQSQQQQPTNDLFKVAESIVNPSKGLMTDQEKAMSVRAIRESHDQIEQQKAQLSAAKLELEKYKKAKEEAEKLAEEAKKKNDELRTTAVQMLSAAVPADPEVIAEMKKAMDKNDDAALRASMLNATIAASKTQQTMQQQLVQMQQFLTEQQKQANANRELELFRNRLSAASNTFPETNMFIPPTNSLIQASSSSIIAPPAANHTSPVNALNQDYFSDQVVRASASLYLKQNNGNMHSGLSNDESWKAKPYKEGSIVDRVLRDDSPQYMGRNTLDTFDRGAVFREASKMNALMTGGNFTMHRYL